jgi:hypothetical protein
MANTKHGHGHGTKAMTQNTTRRTLLHSMAAMYPGAAKEEIQPLGAEVDKGLDSGIEVTAAV